MARAGTVDLLVVGLGPAGARAAAVAASRGLNVLAIDRRRRIGWPVQCAELVPRPVAGYTRGPGVLVQKTTTLETRLPSGTGANLDLPGLVVDRGRFDRALARRAARAGACLRPATTLMGIDAKADQVLLRNARGEPEAVAYRLLIAADGPRSRVAASMGLAALRCVYAQQWTVGPARPSRVCRVFLGTAYAGGYGWVFPRGSLANVGVGMVRASGCKPQAALKRLLGQCRHLFDPAARVHRQTGGLIPVAGLRPALCRGRVLFVGDAGGCTHPISGAGIHPALTSGEAAGAAAAGCLSRGMMALQEYQEEMRDLFGPAHRHALARRRIAETPSRARPPEEEARMRLAWIGFLDYYSGGSRR